MKAFFDLISSTFLILFLLFLIVGNIIRLIYFVKCIRIKKCSNRTCMVKEYCPKHETIWTDKYIEHLEKIIEELCETKNMDA